MLCEIDENAIFYLKVGNVRDCRYLMDGKIPTTVGISFLF